MGNLASCAPAIISTGVVKVLHSDGTMDVHTRAIQAAELMLTNPGHFICDSSQLKIGHRILGLAADEVLERRQLYFVLPMEMLYSVLTAEEMASLTAIATKASLLKHGISLTLAKILPSDFCMFPNCENDRDVLNLDAAGNGAESVDRYSRQRSWRPALETIVESPLPRTFT